MKTVTLESHVIWSKTGVYATPKTLNPDVSLPFIQKMLLFFSFSFFLGGGLINDAHFCMESRLPRSSLLVSAKPFESIKTCFQQETEYFMLPGEALGQSFEHLDTVKYTNLYHGDN